jgi:DNA mismatch repair protein MutL
MIVDQHRAHERILFEKFTKIYESNQGHVQQHLFPEMIELNAADFMLLNELKTEIVKMGFAFEDFGKNTIALSGTPAVSTSASGKELLMGILNDYKRNHIDLSYDKTKSITRAMAKYASIKKGSLMSKEEMSSLIDQLFACSNPNYAPGGEKTYYLLDENTIEKMFN